MAAEERFNCLWVEDNREDIYDVYNRLISDDDWNIDSFSGRAGLVPQLLNSASSWGLVIVDGRMDSEPTVGEEYTGQNIILDLRAGRFGDWGRIVPIILYSGIAEIIDRALTFSWPEPRPLVLSKSQGHDEVYESIVRFGRTHEVEKANPPLSRALLFGTGRIAFGLGLPFFADCPNPLGLIIYGRLSSDDSHVVSRVVKSFGASSKNVTVSVGRRRFHGRVWHDGLSESDLVDALDSSALDRSSLVLFVSNDPGVLRTVMQRVDVASISVGTGIAPVLTALNDAARDVGRGKVSVLALENDHDLVDIGAASCDSLNVFPCVVDRICSELVATECGISVSTDAENYSIAFEPPSGLANSPFVGHPVANCLASKGAVKYVHRRKMLLMNLLHWIIAVVRTYKVILSVNSLAHLDAQLMNVIHDTPTERQMYKLFARLLATYLVRDAEPEVLQSIYGDLDVARNMNLAINREYEFGDFTIDRASTAPDSLTRIVKDEPDLVFAKYARTFELFAADFRANPVDYLERLDEYCKWIGVRVYTKKRIEEAISRINGHVLDIRQNMLALKKRAVPRAPGMSR